MILWLVGMMGSGKSTVGEMVAQSSRAPFHDTDRMVEQMTGESIPATWSRIGEEGFRRLESEAVARAAKSSRGVVATGGGAIIEPANRKAMQRSGTVVWLRSSLDHLLGNLGSGSGRPLIADADDQRVALSTLLERREALYMAVAEHVVNVDGRLLEDVAAEVGELWS